jgi:hypothetical protein
MSTMIYPMRLKPDESVLLKNAARRKGVSLAEFLRQAGRREARQLETEPASLRLSRNGFTLPNWPGATERDKIRYAVRSRHVSR